MRYDLIVIGRSPSGHHGALAAAKLRKRVAIVDDCAGFEYGANQNRTVPSQAIREAILLLTGFRHRDVIPELFQRRRQITAAQLHSLSNEVTMQAEALASAELSEHGVEAISGSIRFVSPHEVEVRQTSRAVRRLTSDRFLIAVGSKPVRPTWIPFDGQTVVDTDELQTLNQIPRSMIVVGGGVRGLEHAMMFAVLGADVGVVDRKTRLLEICDREVSTHLLERAQSLGVTFHLGHEVVGIERINNHQAAVRLDCGQRLLADAVLVAAGRTGKTESLNLPAAGLTLDEHGRLWCNEYFQSWVKHIYGVGEVVGFPAMAHLAIEQGRTAINHAFGQRTVGFQHSPFGFFTIPEFAMIGPTEERLRHDQIHYEVGRANFSESSRGHVSKNSDGLLKLLFARDNMQLLAVHCLGESATELIHVGQTVMSLGGTIDYFRDSLFKAPTLAQSYRVAAKDLLERREAKPLPRTRTQRSRKSRELCAEEKMHKYVSTESR